MNKLLKLKCVKIKKLRKLRLNKQYQWCKKEYQKLNDDGKKAFPTFKQYAVAFRYHNNIKSNYMFDDGICGIDGISWTRLLKWKEKHDEV